jgi:hypothetical protein
MKGTGFSQRDEQLAEALATLLLAAHARRSGATSPSTNDDARRDVVATGRVRDEGANVHECTTTTATDLAY